jgi:hypothetical protein
VRFQAYTEELANIEKIIVDGNGCGRGLQLSHWPRNLTPEPYKADLSVEIVLRWLKAGNNPQENFEVVTNDHFDTDGLLAIWAVLNPDDALRHEKALLSAAEAGDFYHFTSSAAVQFDYIVRAFEDPERSLPATQMFALPPEADVQTITDALLVQLPGLLYATQPFRQLWEEPYSRLLAQFGSRNDETTIREWPEENLSTIVCPTKLGHYARNHFSSGHRILEANPSADGTCFELFYREYLWYDIVSRSVSPRHLLRECARKLNALEQGAGTWGLTEWSPCLRFVQGESLSQDSNDLKIGRRDPLARSSLPVETVEAIVRDELARLDRQAGRG